ncbi:MAG: sulfite exporter TauE/SafE family protein [Acidimicrobiia bacterium]
MTEQIGDRSRATTVWWLVGVGVATGVMAGLLGVGGGIIMVPALVALGYNRHQATATSLAAILLVAVAGAVPFAIAGDVAVSTGVALGGGGLLGSTIGAHWMNRMSGVNLARIFGVVLLIAGLRLAIGGGVSGPGSQLHPLLTVAIELLVGVVAGVLSGLAGIGGGVVLVPAMVLLLGFDQHSAEGTSLLAILFTAAAGTRVNIKHHHVDWRAMVILGAAGAVLAPLSAGLAQRIPAETLGRLFGVFAIVNAVHTLWKARASG